MEGSWRDLHHRRLVFRAQRHTARPAHRQDGSHQPNNLRRPSYCCMSAFPVSLEKSDQLAQRMAALGVREADIEESFVRSGGHGGQNVNKTSTCVMLLHRPTGLQVK